MVVCSETSQDRKYQLLDYYDAKEKYKFNLDLGDGKTFKEKIKYVLDRLSKVDLYRANLYRKLVRSFLKEVEWNTEGSFATDSKDLGSGYILEPGCSIARVVIQRSDEEMALMNTDKKYEIAQQAWEGDGNLFL